MTVPGRVHTIPSGTDTVRFDPSTVDREQVRQELGLDSEQPLIGQVSVRDGKGWHDLLSAFATVAAGFPGARLLLVGCEPASKQRQVMAAATELGIASAVLTLPYRRDMPAVLAACDVVVDASTAGTGITGTIREAMAMERAVVATDLAGNRELVLDGQVGFLVPPGEARLLARALLRLLQDPLLRDHLGRSARQRILEVFASELRIDRLEALYQRLMAERAG